MDVLNNGHLPALLVVVPLLGAPLCVLVHHPVHAARVALLCSIACFSIACTLLARLAGGEPIIYAFGGWAAPLGIAYRLDIASGLVLTVVSGIAAVTALYAQRTAPEEIAGDRIYLFYTAYLLNVSGLLGTAATGDIFNLFVFVEIASLSAYALVSLGRDRRALLAAYRYLMLGSLGATFLLIGIAYLYAMTGTLNMTDMAVRLEAVERTRTVAMAYAFITVGLGLKFALFPLHLWLPSAYTYAPIAIVALFAATATKVFLFAWMRLTFTVFDTDRLFDVFYLDRALTVLAVCAVIAGSLAALRQDNVKRLLAYSSVAQIGYLVLAAALGSVASVAAALFYLINHALIKGCLFLLAGCLERRAGSAELKRMRGLGRDMPWTTAAATIAGMGLVGIPLTSGFAGKWYLLQAALSAGGWLAALPILAGSVLAAAYVWKVLETLYARPDEPGERDRAPPKRGEAPVTMLAPAWLLIAAVAYFGIDSSPLADMTRQAAAGMRP